MGFWPKRIISKRDQKCQHAFEDLKHWLVSPPILAFPDFRQEFVLHTDALDSAIGGVLSQNQDGVIAYWSRQLQKPERNYSTIEKEAIAAVAAIKEFYPHLYGFRFKLVTVHNPLTSLRGLKDTSGRLSRWIIFLQQFQFEFGQARAMEMRAQCQDDLLQRTQWRWYISWKLSQKISVKHNGQTR